MSEPFQRDGKGEKSRSKIALHAVRSGMSALMVELCCRNGEINERTNESIARTLPANDSTAANKFPLERAANGTKERTSHKENSARTANTKEKRACFAYSQERMLNCTSEKYGYTDNDRKPGVLGRNR